MRRKVTIATIGLVVALTAASVLPRGSLLALAGHSRGSPRGPTVESLIRADPGLHPQDKRALIRIVRMARDRFAAEAEQGRGGWMAEASESPPLDGR